MKPKDLTTCIHLYVKHTVSSGAQADSGKNPRWFFRVICVYMFICAMALTIENVGGEFYIFPVAILSGLNFKVTDASYLNILFHGLSATARVLTGVILKYISIRIVIIVSMILSLISGGLLAFIGFNSYILFWILACLLSFFFGNAYPCHVAFTNSYVNVTGFMVALTDMGQALSVCTSIWASAALLDFVGPQAVLIQFWIGVLISLVMTVSVYILGRTTETHKGPQSDRENVSSEDNEQCPLFNE